MLQRLGVSTTAATDNMHTAADTVATALGRPQFVVNVHGAFSAAGVTSQHCPCEAPRLSTVAEPFSHSDYGAQGGPVIVKWHACIHQRP
jgi:hypothetical protein